MKEVERIPRMELVCSSSLNLLSVNRILVLQIERIAACRCYNKFSTVHNTAAWLAASRVYFQIVQHLAHFARLKIMAINHVNRVILRQAGSNI